MHLATPTGSGPRESCDGLNHQSDEVKTIRTSFTFVDGKLQQTDTIEAFPDNENPAYKKGTNEAVHVTPSPERLRGQPFPEVEAPQRFPSPEVVDIRDSFDMSPVHNSFDREEDLSPQRSPEPNERSCFSSTDDIEVSPLPYKADPLEDISSPLLELNENLLMLSPSNNSPPRMARQTECPERF